MPEATTLDPLTPTATETGLAVLCAVHVVLLTVVLVRVLMRKTVVPHGLLGIIALFVLPVVGPLSVLTWQRRVNRYVARGRRTA